jgi:hypothetical protein|uniref:Uncharacterized protein n=1 Tax=viral metagenome TaxID=1070528 RepID=A0A6C0LK48_9ZZZZ
MPRRKSKRSRRRPTTRKRKSKKKCPSRKRRSSRKTSRRTAKTMEEADQFNEISMEYLKRNKNKYKNKEDLYKELSDIMFTSKNSDDYRRKALG